MQCKTENPGRGEFECLKEGRRVTRCARSVYVSLIYYSILMAWSLMILVDYECLESRAHMILKASGS